MPHLTQLIIIGYVMSIGFVSIDIYFPSMPDMATYFAVDENAIQLTVPFFFIGATMAGIVTGPLSDVWGRRKLFMYSMLGVCISSLMCSLSHDFYVLLAARIVHGATNGIIGVIGLAIPQDIYRGKDSAKAMSILGAIFVIAPSVAPYVGGLIHVNFGWQMVFYLLAFLSFIGFLLIVWKIPETCKRDKNKKIVLWQIIADYKKIICNKTYVVYAIQTPIGFSAEICYLTVLPIYFINVLAVSPDEYGLYVFVIVLTYLIGSFSSSKLIDYFGEDKTLLIGLYVALLGGVLLGVFCLFGQCSAEFVTVSLAIHHLGMSWAYPPGLSRALQLFPSEKGTASAVRVTMSYVFAILGGYVASIIDDRSMTSAMFFTILCSVAGLLLFSKLLKDRC